ncbi:pectinesterase QRT1 [Andrographis paniculata]|uniref:pectinesterase QRT1 n=1 Tax=Andrographis paniculata TaxID=175694 RepID=UPI0021E82394|nr:pectinesterase QRT1 [Andrographis paniculata]
MFLQKLCREKVVIGRNKPYISFIGDGNRPGSTIITWYNKASDKGNKGQMLGTIGSASVTIESDYFCASGITFQNTAGPPAAGAQNSQAVALRIKGDKCVFYKTRFEGAQDTLMDQLGTHYFYQSYIEGLVDFIFGYAKSLYQECTIKLVNNAYAVAAHGRESPNVDTGFSFVNCTLNGKGPIYLGRAWKPYSRVVYSYCEFNVAVYPRGWDDKGDSSTHRTVQFGEFKNRGRGADRTGRVPWSKELDYSEAIKYLDKTFIQGQNWLML